MAAMRGPRLQVGSAAWVSEERSSALQIVDSEVEEFSYSARNEMDWLNEHMAGIFDENETNFAETFKTPGKLRGKTPRTARRPLAAEGRVPLSDVFAATPKAPSSHFSPQLNRIKSPQVLRDVAPSSPEVFRSPSPRKAVAAPRPKAPAPDTQDSGYYGSQDVATVNQSFREARGVFQTPNIDHVALHTTTHVPVKLSPTRPLAGDSPEKTFQTAREEQTTRTLPGTFANTAVVTSPAPEPQSSSPIQNLDDGGDTQDVDVGEVDAGQGGGDTDDEISASESSSPIRPMRKNSLSFAPLPARDPLTAAKANGGRVSRVSHNRISYSGRPTGGKSLGNVTVHKDDNEDEHEGMEVEDAPTNNSQAKYEDLAANHHKTYTQRLQDQISMLGKSQPNNGRQSKSVSDGNAAHKLVTNAARVAQAPKSPSPLPMATLKSTPGAFPEDDDDWIEPPTVQRGTEAVASPRPALPKSHSADIMDGLHASAAAAENMEWNSSPQRQTVHETQRPLSSFHPISASTNPASPSLEAQTLPLHKAATVSDLRLGSSSTIAAIDPAQKSPTRSFRDSPLKQAKNKLTSILERSKGLIARGAALSAESKSSILSPSVTRLGHFPGTSMMSLAEDAVGVMAQADQAASVPLQDASPTRPTGKRTRASLEKEKEEKKRDKEAKRTEEQNQRLEKVRAQEREKARDFSKDKETTEKAGFGSWKDAARVQQTPQTTRSSPRKPKLAGESAMKQSDADVQMSDAPTTIPQPAGRSAGPASALRNRELKRPGKPVKETFLKSRQAPMTIIVNTGSQHSQYLTTNSASSAVPADNEPSAQPTQTQQQLSSKASEASLQSKQSSQNLRAAASASRPKGQSAAAKKKEQDERDAQRRRDAKADLERKRIAALEEQRKVEQQKRQEAERQKQKEREQLAQSEARRVAQKQATIEKAKQTRAPPPAARTNAHGPADVALQDNRVSAMAGAKAEGPRPPSRMTAGLRNQEDSGRPTTAQATKAGAKRMLPADPSEDFYKSGPNRAGPSYQAKDAKRRRTSDDFDDKPETDSGSHIKGPPMRPSQGFKKDVPTKAPPQSATRGLFKPTNGGIPFAPHASTATGHPTKTPVRTTALGLKASAAKSAAKQSPKFQNGEAIELPEIQTDDEDDEEDAPRGGMVAAWADSPELRKALQIQETLDPSQIFGPPTALNMEEVFFKSKEKFHKFRSRTSSANWTGADRLTEDDIRKDLAARDKLRREGGWTYEMSKNLL